MELQKDTISRRTLSTSDRARLAFDVIRNVPFNLDYRERPLVRHVVDYLTGSNMITTARFESAATIKLDETERDQVKGMIDALEAIVTDPDLPYDVDIIHTDRKEKLLGLIDELDARFDAFECKARLVALLNDEHSFVHINTASDLRGLEAVVGYLTGTEAAEMEWLADSIAQAQQGGRPFSFSQLDRFGTILYTMERSYPKSVIKERAERLRKALLVSREHPMLGGSETAWRGLVNS